MRVATVFFSLILLPGCALFPGLTIVTLHTAQQAAVKCDPEYDRLPKICFSTEDKQEMLDEVMKHLQIGMPMDRAWRILISNGFLCYRNVIINGVEKERIYRRPLSSGGLGAQLFSRHVIMITLYHDAEVLTEVSLNYLEWDAEELSDEALRSVSTRDLSSEPNSLAPVPESTARSPVLTKVAQPNGPN